METAKLKKFAQLARRSLKEQITAKLKLVLAQDSAARRENTEAIRKLEEAIKNHGKDQVIERVAYIWFNRFCALRFMDVNRYTRIGVVSPAEGQFQPEILAEAKMGHIDDEMAHDKVRQQIFALLDGKAPSRDPQGEAYRLLVVAACNFWNKAMPFLFQRIDDYTELLMPDDLLSGNSILAYTREAMTPDACEDVEVIGWLYQFYISEKKDEVFEGLKKNKKITPENIPAATQLFTPHWIVRYLVENSLGRLWLLNRPGSKLAEQMDYYIKPEQPELEFLKISGPEEIKICDPACGSGHMLTYAFDLLYAIYEEEGYEPSEIPEKILTHNLYGIEIDERAGELAAFALTMKARARQRRFFNKGVKPNICVLGNVQFDEDELREYMDFVGRDLFTAPLQTTLRQFEEADNFGSLIRPEVTDVDGMLSILESKDVSGQLFLAMTHEKVLRALRQADYLSPKYQVVIANPPYMGSKGMNGRMGAWAKANYPDSKADLFAMFIDRGVELIVHHGYSAMVTMQAWMFLSSFESLRGILLDSVRIASLVQIGFNSFPELNSKVAQAAAFVMCKCEENLRGEFYNLNDAPQSSDKRKVFLRKLGNPGSGYHISAENFSTIPGSPLTYWLSERFLSTFVKGVVVGRVVSLKAGLSTGDNNRFQRLWYEVDNNQLNIGAADSISAKYSGARWFPCHSGGDFRKWYGNHSVVINWESDGLEIRKFKGSAVRNDTYYFKSGITWSKISSSKFASRYRPQGFLFDDTGRCGFSDDENNIKQSLGLFCSCLSDAYLSALCPTLSFTSGEIAKIPYIDPQSQRLNALVNHCVETSKVDWDSFETSWDFTTLPLLNPDYRQPTLKATYQKLRAHWREMTLEMQHLEQENNRIFIEAYGLQDELTPEVPLNEITLTCNPHYRYGNDKTEDELETLLLADTLRELVSYAVGCMFGRYSLDAPGLILANQGEGIDYYRRIIEQKRMRPDSHQLSAISNQQNISDAFTESCKLIADGSSSGFQPDEDNVIPMLDGDWFADDIAERFRKFLRVAFGEEHYEENLRFVEQGLNIKGKRNYGIRDYFLGEFYTDHVKRYKKRPIYWLFSSGSGRSGGRFNALIYMHRYRPDTLSVVLNDYLREFRGKLSTQLDHLRGVEASADASKGEKSKALKEIEKLKKSIDELDTWERDVMYPLAAEQIEIDLDDGVKVNYPKFGDALKKIPGLN